MGTDEQPNLLSVRISPFPSSLTLVLNTALSQGCRPTTRPVILVQIDSWLD